MWECAKCGERHEETFEVCWNCGTAIDGTEDPSFRRADGGLPVEGATDSNEVPPTVAAGFSEPIHGQAAAGQPIVTTTSAVEGRRITRYCGLVFGQAVVRAGALRHFLASFSDLGTGRSSAHENELSLARDAAVAQLEASATNLGANAVVGVDLDYETIGEQDPMLMVTVSGTAVVIE
jgi:uncharacterized protein YbjQ (UPF0145 family)